MRLPYVCPPKKTASKSLKTFGMNSCAPVAGGLLAAQEERADLRMIAGELRLLQHRIQQVIFHAGLPRQLGRIVAESAGWASPPKIRKIYKNQGDAEKIRETHGFCDVSKAK